MNCNCREDIIKIFKGDDTDWNNQQFLKVNILADAGIDLSSMSAKFILGSYTKVFPLNVPSFDIDLSAAVTGAMYFGPIKGIIQILDSENRIKTISNSINFFVTDKVFTPQDLSIDVPVSQGSPIHINIELGGSSNIAWGQILGTLSNQTDLQDALDAKQALLTQEQLIAVNSGIDSTKVGQIATNANDIVSIEGDISAIESKIPNQASSSNQLADKDFVNSSISSNTAKFIGTFESVSDLDSYSGTVTNNDYAFVINSVVKYNGGDWPTLADLENYDKSLLTNFDYAWVINGSKFDLYRFDIIGQQWVLRAGDTDKESITLNTAYNRYKASVTNNIVVWSYEYTLNNSSFTADQWKAINSGITSGLVTQIGTNTTDIAGKQDIISDLDTIRSGAALGATAVQPSDLATVATSGDYGDLLNKPTIPTVNDATLTIQKNGTNVATFTANSSTNTTANITVPTQASDIGAQETLVSGTNIKTVNNTSLLGSGNISIDSLPSQTGQSGKYLTTNGTSASWGNINALQNTATGADAITILGNASGWADAVNIGVSTAVGGDGGVAIGYRATVGGGGVSIGRSANRDSNGYRSIAIGEESSSTATESIAIGCGSVSAQYAIQLGRGSNSTASTLQVYSYQLLNSSGKIPSARLPIATTSNVGGVKVDGSTITINNGVISAAGGGSSVPTLTWYKNNIGTTVTISDTSSANLVKVYKNGILLEPTADYSISGTTLTMVTALVATDKITTEIF